jgi:PST family polysaccharide transporter
LLVFPLYSGLVVLADEFVLHLFGPNWTGMVVLIRIMAISFIIQSVGNVSGPLMIALGRTKTVFKLSVGGALLYFAVVLALVPYGLQAVAIGYAVANSIVGLITLIVALRCAQMPLSAFLMNLAKPAMFALLMCVAIVSVQTALDPTTVSSFALMLIVGAATYVALVYRFEEPAWRQVLDALLSRKAA